MRRSVDLSPTHFRLATADLDARHQVVAIRLMSLSGVDEHVGSRPRLARGWVSFGTAPDGRISPPRYRRDGPELRQPTTPQWSKHDIAMFILPSEGAAFTGLTRASFAGTPTPLLRRAAIRAEMLLNHRTFPQCEPSAWQRLQIVDPKDFFLNIASKFCFTAPWGSIASTQPVEGSPPLAALALALWPLFPKVVPAEALH